MSTRDDDGLAGLRAAGAPPMSVDLERIVTAGRRRMRRRRALLAGLAGSGVAGLTALALAFGPGPLFGPPQVSPAIPPPTMTESSAGDGSLQVVDRAGAPCGRLPEPLAGRLLRPADQADLRDVPPTDVLRSVTRQAGDGRPTAVVEFGGEDRTLRVLDLATGATSGDGGRLRAQQTAAGQWDGRYAAYAVQVMGVVSEIRLWDSQTDTVSVLTASGADGWSPAGSPVLGDGGVAWAETWSGTSGSEPQADTGRVVYYRIEGGWRHVVGGGEQPLAIVGQMLWLLDSAEPGAPGRLLVKGVGEAIHDSAPQPLPHVDVLLRSSQTAADERRLLWVDGRTLMAYDPANYRLGPQPLRDLPRGVDRLFGASDGLVIAGTSPGNPVLVVDTASGAMVDAPWSVVHGGAVVTSASGDDGDGGLDRGLNVASSSDWRAALADACRS